MARLRIKFSRLSEKASIPTKANHDDVGFDLYGLDAEEKFDQLFLQPGVTKVKTGIAFATYFDELEQRDFNTEVYCPTKNYYAKIEGRSGLASKGIIPVGGIIDPGYRGDITVALANLSGKTQVIDLKKAIAQLVIYRVANEGVEIVISETVNDDSTRGDKGFGSSDK